MEESEVDGWSVVLQRLPEIPRTDVDRLLQLSRGLDKAVREALPETKRFYTFGLVGRDGAECFPLEAGAGLERSDAERIAGSFRALGVIVEVLPSSEVREVAFRAWALKPDRRARGWRFTEEDGLICTLEPRNARQGIRTTRKENPKQPGWQIERFLNHQHPNTSACSSRVGVRDAMDMAADLGLALAEAYPERAFIVTAYLGADLVSFYQAAEDVPGYSDAMSDLEESRSPWVTEASRTWCDHCGGGQEYEPIETRDAEFPMLRWARSRECGCETVIGARQLFFRVGPHHVPDFRVGGYTPDAGDDGVRVLCRFLDARERPAATRMVVFRIRGNGAP